MGAENTEGKEVQKVVGSLSVLQGILMQADSVREELLGWPGYSIGQSSTVNAGDTPVHCFFPPHLHFKAGCLQGFAQGYKMH